MSNSGAIADRLSMLEVACSKCGRRGRLNVARCTICAKFSRTIVRESRAASVYERCGVHFLQFVAAPRAEKKAETPALASAINLYEPETVIALSG